MGGGDPDFLSGDLVGVTRANGLSSQFEGFETGVGLCDAEAGAPGAVYEVGEHTLALFWCGEFGDWLCCIDIYKA